VDDADTLLRCFPAKQGPGFESLTHRHSRNGAPFNKRRKNKKMKNIVETFLEKAAQYFELPQGESANA
jgi:hypothetical protein